MLVQDLNAFLAGPMKNNIHKYGKDNHNNIIFSQKDLFLRRSDNGRSYFLKMKTQGSKVESSGTEMNELLIILQENKFSPHLVTIDAHDLERYIYMAEVHLNGKSHMCFLNALKGPSSEKNVEPRVEVVLIDDISDTLEKGSIITVDLGQITTVWCNDDERDNFSSLQDVVIYLNSMLKRARQAFESDLPANHVEVSMQNLYNSYVGRARGRGSLTKKQISKIASKSVNQSRVEEILRKAVKAGDGMSRLVDSAITMNHFYDDYPSNRKEELTRRFLCAEVLSLDSNLGGRFKRMPIIFVGAEFTEWNDGLKNVDKLIFLNGGWIVQDISVRAGSEARKFAERNLGNTSTNDDTNVTDDTSHKKVDIMTAADERIVKRLECLAMGEDISESSRGESEKELELDLRESLRALNLPISPKGAQRALIQLGIWSEEDTNKINKTGTKNKFIIQPWSGKTIIAANEYASYAMKTSKQLFLDSKIGNHKQNSNGYLDGRTDLTNLPTVCVDAQRASFRDDAIGVRPRSSTGRKVIEAASKWEILIHIADVSDIYSPILKRDKKLKCDTSLLKEAAESRGVSRYDLPLGPLHLMPPTALTALALSTKGDPDSQKETEQIRSVNRCVTLWAYIDERNGKLIDAGLERTLISSPVALSFTEASNLLESSDDTQLEPALKRGKAILAVAERNILRWSQARVAKDKSARLREERLSVKEMISQQTVSAGRSRDGGQSGSFQRTRGHLIVDAALDLYGYALSGLLWRKKAPVPRASGSGTDRGGRLGTAPLRRYIDGIAQQQALSVLCNYGGKPMTRDECINAGKIATKAMNNISNFRSRKDGPETVRGNSFAAKQRTAIKSLNRHLAITGGKDRVVPAMTTGRKNEVIILGVGAVARCLNLSKDLKRESRIKVQVVNLNEEKGILEVKCLGQ